MIKNPNEIGTTQKILFYTLPDNSACDVICVCEYMCMYEIYVCMTICILVIVCVKVYTVCVLAYVKVLSVQVQWRQRSGSAQR